MPDSPISYDIFFPPKDNRTDCPKPRAIIKKSSRIAQGTPTQVEHGSPLTRVTCILEEAKP